MAELVGPGAIAAAGATSVIFSTPFPHRPGDKARDTEGNEYVFVDFTAPVYYGCLVQITSIYLAAPLLGTANIPYRVGVVCSGTPSSVAGNHPTSDNAGWVQIYGVHPAVQTETATDAGVSATAAAFWCIPQTSVGTPSGTLSVQAHGVAVSEDNTSIDGNPIHNMWLVDFAEVTDLTTWPGSSGAPGPTPVGTGHSSGGGTPGVLGQ